MYEGVALLRNDFARINLVTDVIGSKEIWMAVFTENFGWAEKKPMHIIRRA